jgi:hypothetical protein
MISLFISIIIIGIIAWVVLSLPIPAPFRNVLYGLLLIFLVILIANFFGYGPSLHR